jgi:hypothetical protein
MRAYAVACYCERCGLRLVAEENASSQVQFDNSNLISWPSEAERPGPLRNVSKLKAAASPLGLPGAAHRPYILNVKTRYKDLKPVRVFNLEMGSFGLPSKATDATAGRSYIFESPGVPPIDKSAKKDPQYLQNKCAWSFGSPLSHLTTHFRIIHEYGNSSSREIAQVRLYGGSNWNADIRVIDHRENKIESDSATKPYTRLRMLATDESAWRIGLDGVLWASSKGLLFWSERTVEDGDHVKSKMLCLLDAYDRLLLAVGNMRQPGKGGKGWQIRVYTDLTEDFLGEILASYTALRCQQERIRQEHMFDSS